jgi:hypothetical protein
MAKEYKITRTAGVCSQCGRQLQEQEEYVATVVDSADEEDFQRKDYCLGCWDESSQGEQDTTNLLGLWRARVPRPTEKKKLFVDDELLVNFFHRLDDSPESAKVHFRFVLALVLMRKKLLVYDRAEKQDDGQDVWMMHFKGSPQREQVVDPHMDEDKIAQVSHQLGEILEGEL